MCFCESLEAVCVREKDSGEECARRELTEGGWCGLGAEVNGKFGKC